jgi:hypothetical protein
LHNLVNIVNVVKVVKVSMVYEQQSKVIWITRWLATQKKWKEITGPETAKEEYAKLSVQNRPHNRRRCPTRKLWELRATKITQRFGWVPDEQTPRLYCSCCYFGRATREATGASNRYWILRSNSNMMILSGSICFNSVEPNEEVLGMVMSVWNF